jgi:CheY-like chemotaxis protein
MQSRSSSLVLNQGLSGASPDAVAICVVNDMESILELAQSMAKTPKILVVDDEYVIHRAFTKLAESYDLEVTCVDSPASGLTAIAASEYDLVFLDIRFSGPMDGMDVLRELEHKHSRSHVVVMSGSVNLHSIMAEANDLGVLSFIIKPVAFSIDYVKKILSRLGVRFVPRSIASQFNAMLADKK